MKRIFAILLALSLLLLAACVAAPTEAEPPAPPQEEEPAPIVEEPPAPEPEPFPGKIAIITEDVSQNKEEYRSAQQLVAKYGEDKIIHKILPVRFEDETQKIIVIMQVTVDPEIHALIISPRVQNILTAVDKLLETRQDIFLVAVQPPENFTDIEKRFHLILNVDEIAMGPAMAQQAYKMGAKTFVHYATRRGGGYTLVHTMLDLLAEKCEELGMELVYARVPDPMSDAGIPAARQALLEDVPKMIEKYGRDTAFFCNNCDLQETLITAVADNGAIFPQPCHPSPYHGFPLALGLADGDDDMLPLDYVITETARVLAGKGVLGRFSTWPVPASMLCTNAAVEYAVKWLNGEVPRKDIDVLALKRCMDDYAGLECYLKTYADWEGVEYPNWFLVREDYLTYGEESIKSN
jgi:hypothetical protein